VNYFLIIVLSAFTSSVFAQNIIFQDPKFKNALVNTKCIDENEDGIGDIDADLNNDGEIDTTEALKVKSLIVSFQEISNLNGIECFKNLSHLFCTNNQLTTLNLKEQSKLKYLRCEYNKLSNLDVKGLVNLQILNCNYNNLTTLVVKGLESLTSLSCDFNNLSSMDATGLENLESLFCHQNKLTSLNIKGIRNLKEVYCGKNSLATLNLEGLENLRILWTDFNKLDALDIKESTKLINLSCSSNQLTSLNLLGINNLRSFNCGNNMITALNVSELDSLLLFTCNLNQLSVLDVSQSGKLVLLNCASNQLTSLSLSGVNSLQFLYCGNNKLTFLDMTGLDSLRLISCYQNLISSLTLSASEKLITLDCFENQLTFIDVLKAKKLQNFNCRNNKLTSLDVSGLDSLQTLLCQENELSSLFIKTSTSIRELSFESNPNLSYICCNQNKINEIKNRAIINGIPNCEVSSYCTFISGKEFYSLKGKISLDANNNGCDNGTLPYPNLTFNVTDGIESGSTLTNFAGTYSIRVQEGTHTITPILADSINYEVVPQSYTFTFSSIKDSITQNFCVSRKGAYVQFQDINFKNALIHNICIDTNGDDIPDSDADTNNDNEISFLEAYQIKSLILKDNPSIISLDGIQNFKNLSYLSIDKLANLENLHLTHLFSLKSIFLTSIPALNTVSMEYLTNLSRCSIEKSKIETLSLKYLWILDSIIINESSLHSLAIDDLDSLSKLDFSKLKELKYFEISSSDFISELIISDLPQIETIFCASNLSLVNLEVNNVESLTNLRCGTNILETLTIKNAPLLSYLDCSLNRLKSLKLQNASSLSELSCGFNLLENLDLDSIPNLQYLACHGNTLTTLNLTNLNNLISLSCFQNLIENLYFTNTKELTEIDCSGNNISSLDLSELENLTYVDFRTNNIDQMILGPSQDIWYLDGSENLITSFNVNHLDSLVFLLVNNNLLDSLTLNGLNKLAQINLSKNGMRHLILQNLPNVEVLNCGYNDLQSVNLNTVKGLYQLYLEENDLNELFIKNGNLDGIEIFMLSNNPNLKYVCIDEDETEYISDVLKNEKINNYELNTYCNFTPSNSKYFITGTAYYDSNNNGCDTLDPVLPNLKIKIERDTTHYFNIANNSGNWSISLTEGSYWLTPIIPNQEYFIVQPPELIISPNTTSDTVIQNFCIRPKEPFSQMNISILPLSPPARPGFNASYKIIFENTGNKIINGTLQFFYEEALLDYISASNTPDQIAAGTIKWNFSNLLPFEKREIIITLNVNKPTDTPAVNAGDKLTFIASTSESNFKLETAVVGSYDPNDKTCLQGDLVHPDLIGKYVDYIIRFENTGNYAAENVVVKDIIDPKLFDISTLQITASSHEMFTRMEGNKVEFIFENIQLPFDDANNDGYIAFKIKTLPTLVLGDTLKNLADIYFDYNFPIRTNEAQSKVAFPVATNDITIDINIYPNPVRDVLHVDTQEAWNKAEIYDLNGRILRSLSLHGSTIDMSSLKSGTYFLRFRHGDKTGSVKFVKI